MRKYLLSLTIPLIFLAADAASVPEGCPNESALASAAAKLAEQDWHSVSLAKLRTIWPTELSGLNCDADVCHSVWSMDRIIAGHCECCTTFAFRIHQNGSDEKTEQLDEVVLNYSAAQREQLVEAAKKIASATGLGQAELATVGRADDQDFHWANTSGVKRQLSSITIKFSRRGQAWELFLNWGRNSIQPIPAKAQ